MSKEIDIIIKEAREELDELFGLPFKLGRVRKPKGIKRLSTPDDKEVYKKTVEDDFFSDDSAGSSTFESSADIPYIAKTLASNEEIMRGLKMNPTIKNIIRSENGPKKLAGVIMAILHTVKNDMKIEKLKENLLKEVVRAIVENKAK